MNKNGIFKIWALILVFVLLLCACTAEETEPTEQITEQTQQVTEETKQETEPVEEVPETEEFTATAGVCVPQATVYESYDAKSNQCATLQEGEKVQLAEKTTDGTWYKCDQGWVKAEELYIFENGQESEKYAVARADVAVYDHIGGNVTEECYVIGDRILISCQISDGEKKWGKTETGWLDLTDFYVEGDTGLRSTTGIVIDKTPLNVRLGPSTKQKVIGTLEVGITVEILDQVTVGDENWGYVYCWKSTDVQNGYYVSGWVYMPMVSDELYNWIYSDAKVKESWVASKKPEKNKDTYMYSVDYSVFKFYENGKFEQYISWATNYSEYLDSDFSVEVMGGPIGYYDNMDYGTYTMENGVLKLNYMYTETIDELDSYVMPHKKTVTVYYEMDETEKTMTLSSASALFGGGKVDNRMCKLPDEWVPSDVGAILGEMFREPVPEDEEQWQWE